VLTVDAGLLLPAKPVVPGKPGKLASTGADVGWLIVAGVLTLAAGAVLTLFGRRARRRNAR
jgi:LPXTG-motif cell wall-anchored protein